MESEEWKVQWRVKSEEWKKWFSVYRVCSENFNIGVKLKFEEGSIPMYLVKNKGLPRNKVLCSR